MRNDAIAILVLAVVVGACNDQPVASAAPPSGLRPISIRVDGPSTLNPPAEVQFTALQLWSDGSTRDVTASAMWSSSNPSVLSVNGGLAKALATGEVRLLAHLGELPVNPKGVRVTPAMPEWNALYTLTIGGGTCNESLPLQPELRVRRYTANIDQDGLSLNVTVDKVGRFEGRITNPEVRFTIFRPRTLSRRVQRASITGFDPGVVRRAAYSGDEPDFVEVINGYRLAINGNALTTMSPSGFAGTLDGTLALYELTRSFLVGVCTSSSHGFTLVRN